jgi:hypothetical protein
MTFMERRQQRQSASMGEMLRETAMSFGEGWLHGLAYLAELQHTFLARCPFLPQMTGRWVKRRYFYLYWVALFLFSYYYAASEHRKSIQDQLKEARETIATMKAAAEAASAGQWAEGSQAVEDALAEEE